ncbi:MAG: hypothetical protein V7L05_22100 [Nostoc sp.]|uniref:hypothetical protein n=1 Tax=Nostoc sp. TaxID=1180 RepID=UPI002FF7CF35
MLRNYLGTPTIDERCGVILEFEYACPDKFAQLVTNAPQWTNIHREERPQVKAECLRLLTTLKLSPARMQLISGFVDMYLRLDETEKQVFQVAISTMD